MIALFNKFPFHIQIAFQMFISFLLLFTLFRMVFFFLNFAEMNTLSLNYLSNSFLIGFRFDTRLTVLILLPFLLFSWVLSVNGKWFHKFWGYYWSTIFTVILCLYVADLGHYSYINTRLDASILGLAQNFLISTAMVWESYPVIPIILLMVGLIWAFAKLVQQIHFLKEKTPRGIKKSILIYSITLFIFLGIGYGKWSRYPFRWSDAFYSTNHSANQLAINPVLYFLNTWSRVNESYDLDGVREYYPLISEFLGVDNPNLAELNFSRQFNSPVQNKKEPNIVIIILETFPAFKCGILGNPLNPTPNFDALANESILFSRFYVPKLSTAAAIFSTLTGLPDMAIINKSSTRDPFAIHQDLFINQLPNYQKHFFIGGSANWGDLNGFLKNNINDIIIHEEGSYTMPETNAWGISDYHLLQETDRILAKESEPFIAIVLTAGHHRPYTIPENISNFEKSGFTMKHRDFGFGEDDYYAFKFMDFALGEFIVEAKKRDYFDNTLFVVLGDHGSHGNHLNLTHGDLTLHSYHVPMIMYGPGLDIKSSVYDGIVSQIDIFPSLLSLLNIPHKNSSLGRNLFANHKTEELAFLFSASSQRYGLITNSQYLIHSSAYNYQVFNPLDSSLTPKELEIKSQDEKMAAISTGLYETAQFLRYANSRGIK